MTRLAARFDTLKTAKEGCLCCYLMAGDPDLAFSREAILAVADGGADIIEVGIPFSDPLADGPTIQSAATRSLRVGTTPGKVFQMISKLRDSVSIPLVAMTDYNLLYRFGLEQFSKEAANAGFNGAIVPNLPVQQSGDWLTAAHKNNLDTIFLAAPTSTPESLKRICETSTGFVYLISLKGVTGARETLPPGLMDLVGKVKRLSPTPVLVGFGISSAEQVSQICKVCDGVVVGSALVEILGSDGSAVLPEAQPRSGVKGQESKLTRANEKVRQLKQATKLG